MTKKKDILSPKQKENSLDFYKINLHFCISVFFFSFLDFFVQLFLRVFLSHRGPR